MFSDTPAEQRDRVLERDGGECQYCGGEKNVDVHHITHRDKGGRHELENLVCLCKSCHRIAHSVVPSGEDPVEVMEEKGIPRQFVDREEVSRWAAPILDQLHEGRVTPGYVANKCDLNRDRVNSTMREMDQSGWVDKIGHGLYELNYDPREDVEVLESVEGGASENIGAVIAERDELREQVEDLRDRVMVAREVLEDAE